MAKGLFIANIIGTLPELGTDLATKNWGDFAATLIEDAAQGALLYIDTKGSEKAKELLANAKTEVLEVALLFVESMNVLNGFGQEEDGSKFVTAGAFFGTADEALKYAKPDDHWQGSAAEAYAAENDKQAARVKSLEELDGKIQEILERQAAMVEDTRNFLGIWKGVITVSIFIALALYAYAGPQASMGFQILVAFASIAAVAAKELLTAMASVSIGQEVDTLATQYQAVADAAHLPSEETFFKIRAPQAVETKVSSFDAISNSMSGSFVVPDPASLAGVAKGSAGAADGSGDQRAPAGAPTGESETPADETSGVTVEEMGPATSESTMPTVAQLAAVSGHPLTLPGQTSRRQRSAVPADNAAATEAAPAGPAPAEEAAPAGPAPAAGVPAGVESAGSGTDGAERAPVEVTVGAEEAQSPPSPLQQSV